MRFVSSLITICDQVTNYLTQKKQTLIKSLPQFPADMTATPSAKWLSTLNAEMDQISIDTACAYSKKLDDERITNETALAEKNIEGRLKAIAQERATITNIKASLTSLKEKLSDAELQALVTARLDAQTKRNAASQDAAKVFENAPSNGVGQESWMLLWEQARKFSKAHAYKTTEFPSINDGDRCVLCQQELAPDAKERLGHFEQFVKSGLEASAQTAENALNELTRKLPAIPNENDWNIQANALKIDEKNAAESLAALALRRNAADVAQQFTDIPDFDWSPYEQAVAAISEAHLAEEKSLKELQQDGKRKEIEARVLELKALQWLNQNKQAIATEVERLNKVAVLDKAIGLANTTKLTKKNTELAKQELNAGYQTRFANELKLLGGERLPVKPESKQQGKGETTFILSLQGARKSVPAIPAESVLSEGETRVVALAAFLADITGSDQPTPFIFDDPISSLDHYFEGRVVERLVELAKSRQVIVFTHRLSLLSTLEDTVEKLGKQAKLEGAGAFVSLHIESIHRLDNLAGFVSQLNVRDAKPEKAINRFHDEMIPRLRKLRVAGDITNYEKEVKGVCSDFRILIESCVENVLLNQVVLRYRHSVQTLNRLGTLAKIQAKDCALIDDLMTRYSVFEHSQPKETPAMLPEIDRIAEDVKALADWIKEFKERAVAKSSN